MRIAVVGAGISGLTVARLLCREHEVSVFDVRARIGGHTHTVEEKSGDRSYPVDTGFIVFNAKMYPNFMTLLRKLGIPWQESDMSFGVHCDRTGIEYCPSSFDSLFAQRRNLFRPRFWRMLKDLTRFRKGLREMIQCPESVTLGHYLTEQGYHRWFCELFILPMGAAIWSAAPSAFLDFPATMFARFFHNHRFLETEQPQWLTVRCGSRQYLDSLTRPFQDRIHTQCPVQRIARHTDGVTLTFADQAEQTFDEVVLALHSDQALTLLSDPSDAERATLEAIAYQDNEVVLHTDTDMLPRSRKAWASWNYHIPATPQDAVSMTYNMNRLQQLDAPETFCVTLNPSKRIDPAKIRRKLNYSHPVFTPAALAAQRRHDQISGQRHTHYCGAYWGYGFHEDGVNSALTVAKQFGRTIHDL